MKKMILGLCFTVGFAGMSFANHTIENTTKERLRTIEVVSVVKEQGCASYLVYRVWNCDDTYSLYKSPIKSYPCGEGMKDGTMTVLIVKDQYASCDG